MHSYEDLAHRFLARPHGARDAAAAHAAYRKLLAGLSDAPSTGLPLQDDDPRVPRTNLAAYDYLGLSRFAEIRSAAHAAVDRWGTGTGGSPVTCGTLEVHEALSEDLARHTGQEAAVLFSSGYAANVGVVSMLARPGDLVVMDQYAHASAVDGARMSGARIMRFRHNDPDHLARRLGSWTGSGQRLVYVEGIYSMEGDTAPLAAVSRIAGEHDALLMVDEAHSEFLVGFSGGGACTAAGVVPDVHMGTLSKTLNCQGGFVSGAAWLMDWISGVSRSRMFSGSLSPVLASAARAAIRVAVGRPELREDLARNSAFLRRRLAHLRVPVTGDSQIVPVHIGDSTACALVSARLAKRGIDVFPVAYPAVPEGRARLRLSVTAAHTVPELERAALAIAQAIDEVLRAPAGLHVGG